MHKRISWTIKLGNGIKRETRVEVNKHNLKWQFKRSDEARWDYTDVPTPDDWDRLEDILRRRAGRGRATTLLPAVQRLRAKAGT